MTTIQYNTWVATANVKYLGGAESRAIEDAFEFVDCPDFISVDLTVQSSFGEKDDEAKVAFVAKVWDTSTPQREVFSMMDSFDDASGEAGFQLFSNNCVHRAPMLRGYLIFTNPNCNIKITPKSADFLKSYPGSLRAMYKALFEEVREVFTEAERFDPDLYMTFAFLGQSTEFHPENYDIECRPGTAEYDEFMRGVQLSQSMIPMFQKAGCATFLCTESMLGFDDYYIAFFSELAIDDKREEKCLKSVDFKPQVIDPEDRVYEDDDEEFYDPDDECDFVLDIDKYNFEDWDEDEEEDLDAVLIGIDDDDEDVDEDDVDEDDEDFDDDDDDDDFD